MALLEVDRESGEEAAEELKRFGPVSFSHCDVSEEGAVREAVACVRRAFGRIDGLVNNAGLAGAHGARLEDLSLDAWNRVLAVNLTGVFLCSKYCATHLRAARGAIVNIASTRALMSEAHTEAYSASKGGVLALTHALAASLAPDVRVNAVSPGWIDVGEWKKSSSRRNTPLTAEDHGQHLAGRVGRPEDVGALVAFLLSEHAGFITGANHVCDGGMTRKMIYA